VYGKKINGDKMKKKVLVFFSFYTMLFANEIKITDWLQKIPLYTATFGSEVRIPKWVETIPDDDKQCKYFVGHSSWYIKNDIRSESLAKAEAGKSALDELSKFLGVNVSSEFNMKKEISNDYSSTKMDKTIKTKTSQFIQDIKPKEIFIDENKKDENIKAYVLVCLDSSTQNKLETESKKDKEEFDTLLVKANESFLSKNYYEAKNYLALAKGKRSAYMDNSVVSLEQQIKKIYDDLIEAKIEMSDTAQINQNIEFSGSLTQNGYLYIFENENGVNRLIYPNISTQIRQFKKFKYFNGNEDLISKSYDNTYLEKDIKWTFLASKMVLPLAKHKLKFDNDEMIFDNSISEITPIKECLKNSKCTLESKDINITSEYIFPKLKIQIKSNQAYSENIINEFSKNGFISTDSNTTLSCVIDKSTRFSQSLNTNIITLKINIALLDKNNKTISDIEVVASESDYLTKIFSSTVELIDKNKSVLF
jgi:hypothetical protein